MRQADGHGEYPAMNEYEQTWRANLPAVAHEAFDDEAILIHFESGRYFSLNATGRAIWAALVEGTTLPAIVERLAAGFDADDATLRAAARRFLDQLVAEGLAVAGTGPRAASPVKPDAARTGARAPFAAPQLDVYSDMQDLLLLDPIHDVGATGWPRARE